MDGVLGVWSDVEAAAIDDYDAWYEREHMFDRLAVPGFHRARHYLTVSGEPRYFTYFVTEDAAVMASEAYRQSADNPSDWTRRVLPHFRNVNRTACNVIHRFGRGYGAAALTARLTADGEAAARLIAWLGEEVLPALVQWRGVMATELWQADRAATLVPVADRELRGASDQIADLVVFVDGVAVAPLQALADGLLAPESFADEGAADAQVCVHQLVNGAERDE